MTRTCKRCGETKPINQFPTTGKYYREDGTTINWRKHTCRKCLRSKQDEPLLSPLAP